MSLYFVCPDNSCNQSFTIENEYDVHVTAYHGLEKIAMPLTEESQPAPKSQTVADFLDDVKTYCVVCERPFRSVKIATDHVQKVHLTDNINLCRKCGYQPLSVIQSQKHAAECGIAKFFCSKCPSPRKQPFASQAQLRVHWKADHQRIPNVQLPRTLNRKVALGAASGSPTASSQMPPTIKSPPSSPSKRKRKKVDPDKGNCEAAVVGTSQTDAASSGKQTICSSEIARSCLKKPSILPEKIPKSFDDTLGNSSEMTPGIKVDSLYLCLHCPFEVNDLALYKAHGRHHAERSGSLRCQHCSFGTDSAKLLTEHMSVHFDADELSRTRSMIKEMAEREVESKFKLKHIAGKKRTRIDYVELPPLMCPSIKTDSSKTVCPFCGKIFETTAGCTSHMSGHLTPTGSIPSCSKQLNGLIRTSESSKLAISGPNQPKRKYRRLIKSVFEESLKPHSRPGQANPILVEGSCQTEPPDCVKNAGSDNIEKPPEPPAAFPKFQPGKITTGVQTVSVSINGSDQFPSFNRGGGINKNFVGPANPIFKQPPPARTGTSFISSGAKFLKPECFGPPPRKFPLVTRNDRSPRDAGDKTRRPLLDSSWD